MSQCRVSQSHLRVQCNEVMQYNTMQYNEYECNEAFINGNYRVQSMKYKNHKIQKVWNSHPRHMLCLPENG